MHCCNKILFPDKLRSLGICLLQFVSNKIIVLLDYVDTQFVIVDAQLVIEVLRCNFLLKWKQLIVVAYSYCGHELADRQ